jgi:hypothetical protein
MKRFYCTICKKMKRVQRMPVIIENANSETPEARRGVCNRHSGVSYRTRPGSIARKVGA